MNKNIFFLVLLVVCKSTQSTSLYIRPLLSIIKKNPSIQYLPCHKTQTFTYQQFPLSVWPEQQPHKGLFAQLFIITIPKGQVCSDFGLIKINDDIIEDLLPQSHTLQTSITRITNASSFKNLKKIPGKVAVITTVDASCYSHWIQEVLGRLTLLEQNGIEYDWLYVSSNHRFQKETLELWGIDPAKIIDPFNNSYIQADELIVPSYTTHRSSQSWMPFMKQINLVYYFTPWCIEYIRNKFLPLAQKHELEHPQNFSKKVFISRQNANQTKIINEDEVFELFKQQGFTRYHLENMSILEQIILFQNAEFIVAPHGSGLTNMIFCKPETRIVEIFQARSDCSFFYLSQIAGLKNYQCIQTMEFKEMEGFIDTYIPLEIIQTFINTEL